ncbi:hypothetical protein GCM10027578_23380 [Spirosoma luteolum]
MTRLFYTFLFIGAVGLSDTKAQLYVNGNPIDSATVYCQLFCQNVTPLLPARVAIDYGQPFQLYRALRRQKITGPDKKPVFFESAAGALNFMDRNGWELVSFQTNLSTYTYLLRRRPPLRR